MKVTFIQSPQKAHNRSGSQNQPLEPLDIKGWVIYDRFRLATRAECSQECSVNDIHQNAWSQTALNSRLWLSKTNFYFHAFSGTRGRINKLFSISRPSPSPAGPGGPSSWVTPNRSNRSNPLLVWTKILSILPRLSLPAIGLETNFSCMVSSLFPAMLLHSFAATLSEDQITPLNSSHIPTRTASRIRMHIAYWNTWISSWLKFQVKSLQSMISRCTFCLRWVMQRSTQAGACALTRTYLCWSAESGSMLRQMSASSIGTKIVSSCLFRIHRKTNDTWKVTRYLNSSLKPLLLSNITMVSDGNLDCHPSTTKSCLESPWLVHLRYFSKLTFQPIC